MLNETFSVIFKHHDFNFLSRESKFIGILMVGTITCWLAWMLSALILNESYGPPCFGFGLIGVCLLTFLIMFVPKSRQLSAIGKEGIYLEDHVADHVDRFSFRSNDPNQYSPSFYHFRPAKTSVSRPSGSIRKEFRSNSPYYKAEANSYTGKKKNCELFFFSFLTILSHHFLGKTRISSTESSCASNGGFATITAPVIFCTHPIFPIALFP